MDKKRMTKRIIISIFIILLVVISAIIYIVFSLMVPVCNDGTLAGECSEIKPYFCLSSGLAKNTLICGCDDPLTAAGDDCISEYQTNPKNISLDYILRGNRKILPFTVYGGMNDYISKIPRYISSNENPTVIEFKLKTINEEMQRFFLLPLVIQIENLTKSKEDQARIAISIVQNIEFGNSTKSTIIGNTKIDYQRYPYEVLYDMEGICSEKTELLVFLLREIGYGTAFIDYIPENHEVAGIECPKDKSVRNSGYCFVETTAPSIITDDKNEYIGVDELKSTPQIINVSDGLSLGNVYEYRDARRLIWIRADMKKYNSINFLQHLIYQNIKKKYGLTDFYDYTF